MKHQINRQQLQELLARDIHQTNLWPRIAVKVAARPVRRQRLRVMPLIVLGAALALVLLYVLPHTDSAAPDDTQAGAVAQSTSAGWHPSAQLSQTDSLDSRAAPPQCSEQPCDSMLRWNGSTPYPDASASGDASCKPEDWCLIDPINPDDYPCLTTENCHSASIIPDASPAWIDSQTFRVQQNGYAINYVFSGDSALVSDHRQLNKLLRSWRLSILADAGSTAATWQDRDVDIWQIEDRTSNQRGSVWIDRESRRVLAWTLGELHMEATALIGVRSAAIPTWQRTCLEPATRTSCQPLPARQR